jgi:Tol biopolymer transport system component
MDDEMHRTLASIASRGQDPGPQTVWARATTAAHRRRRRATIAVTVATTIVLVVAAGAFAIQEGTHSPRVATIGPRSSTPPQPATADIAFTRDNTIWTMDPSGSHARPITRAGCCIAPAWSPDHREIAIGDDDARLTIVTADGTFVRSFDVAAISAPSWSPDGTRIAFAASPASGYNGGPIQIVNANGRGEPQTFSRAVANSVAWSPDGTQIAFTTLTEPRHVALLTLATAESPGTISQLPMGPGQEQWDPAWTPAGRITFASTGGIDAIDRDGRRLQRIVSCPAACGISSPTWSRDGSRVAYDVIANGVAQIAVADTVGARRHQLTHAATGSWTPAW